MFGFKSKTMDSKDSMISHTWHMYTYLFLLDSRKDEARKQVPPPLLPAVLTLSLAQLLDPNNLINILIEIHW